MVARVRRNRPVKVNATEIEELMKSISTSQDLIERHSASVKMNMANLFLKFKAAGLKMHTVDDIVAELYRPAGRSTNVIDPKKFKKAVSEKDFFEAVTVGVTKAKALLPGKVLDAMMTNIPATPGEETIKVGRIKRGS